MTYENELADNYKLILQIVRDADRIQAIGKEGIHRCYRYTKAANKNITDENVIADLVIQHCHDKLLRLYRDPGFIVTPRGRQIAEPLHQEMVTIIESIDKTNRLLNLLE